MYALMYVFSKFFYYIAFWKLYYKNKIEKYWKLIKKSTEQF